MQEHPYFDEALSNVRRGAVASLLALDAFLLGDEVLGRLAESRRGEVEYFIRFLRRVSRKLVEHTPLSEVELELVKIMQRGDRGLDAAASGIRELADILESILRGVGGKRKQVEDARRYRRLLIEFIDAVTIREERLLRIR